MQPRLYRLYWIFGWFYDFTRLVTILFVVSMVLHFFIVTVNVVQGNSMTPTYMDGEIVLVDRFTYRLRSPARGEVVSFYFPGAENRKFVKRIIALAGDRVTIQDNRVSINGEVLVELYLPEGTKTLPDLSYTLEPGEYYVLGDGRHDSLDSRVWGGLPESYIIGQVMGRVPEAGTIQQWARATLQRFWIRGQQWLQTFQ